MRPIEPPRDARPTHETTHDSGASAQFAAPVVPPVATTRTAARWAGHLLIGAVMLSVAAMSWAGLFAFAHDVMHWSSWHAALVPIALDIAALACAMLALDSVMRNDSAASFRLITAALIGLSAFTNWRRALLTHNIAEELFFPAMSVLSYALVDAVIRKSRRDTRRDRMGLSARPAPYPLPSHGVAAWARFPGRAFRATSNAIAQRIDESAPAARAIDARAANDVRRRDYANGVIDGMTQANAIRHALTELGDVGPTEVVAWLAENGRPGVAPQRVSDVVRRDRANGGRHRAPGGLVAIPGGNDGGEIAS